MSLLPKTVEVAGHKVSAWGVGTRRFINFSTRYPDKAEEVKAELEKEGWSVVVEDMGYGIYMLTSEITVPPEVKDAVEEVPDEPITDSSDSELE